MKMLWTVWLSITSALAFEYHLEPVNVDRGIYCFFGKPEAMNTVNNGNMVNSCYVDTGRRWLVIDSGPTHAYAKEAAAKMQAIKAQPTALVIDTHVHDDHWLGNGYFAAAGIPVYGPGLFQKAVNPQETTRMQKRISPEAYAGTQVVLPSHSIDANETLDVDGETLRIIRLTRKAHTAEDLMVYLPKRETLFAGDLVFNDRIPSLRDGDLHGWIAALETVQAMPLKHIIGGHGKNTGKDALQMTYVYLTQLRDRVRDAIDDGIGIAEATKTIRLDAFRSVALYDAMHAQNVEVAYRMLEWDDE
ncbi:MBL fold metallo-hydrolase [Sulfurimonas sp. HSL-1656]|uniref:MBL fold metallo-hydrolase n=1 Tax=Thiomicrolovo subterrani TaxID=3131934 RepID=UPI0031F8289D